MTKQHGSGGDGDSHKTSGGDTANARKVPCPTCSKPSVFAPQNPWRPFCSERCRGVDLGAWANESYRVGTQSEPDEDNSPSELN